MACVVFLRGVNVGGNKKFKPSVLAEAIGAVNLGAAGTLIVRREVSEKSLRREVLRRLPFEAEVMICPGRDVAALRWDRVSSGVKRFVSVLARSCDPPDLPITSPPKGKWQIRVVRLTGPFALSEWRRVGDRLLYPNEVVEKAFGVPATTRAWSTMEAVQRILAEA